MSYADIDFTPLLEATADEVVTHSLVRDVTLPSGKILALITLDNGLDYKRPSTLGPHSLMDYSRTLDELKKRAASGEIHAVAVTGTPYIFAAGADLSKIDRISSRSDALLMAQLGHFVLPKLGSLGVPSFAFLNGLTLGGALELALQADYRTVDTSVAGVAFPEVFLGLIPGWGGATILPNLIGIEKAIEVIITNPLKNNRMLKGADALRLGIVDAAFGPARFLEDSLRWASNVLEGSVRVERPFRPRTLERLFKWKVATSIAQKTLKERLGTAAKAPYAAIELLAAARDNNLDRGYAREDEIIADLIAGDQFRASIYAFDLVQKRAKHPVGAPDKALAVKIQKIGVIGAGLMASQFALLFARKLRVPVVITDLDQERVDKALNHIRSEIQKMNDRGRLGDDDAKHVTGLITGTTDRARFADCDWVIEAVFEELSVKQQVFSEMEAIVREDCILATNTSSLSVDSIGSGLKHPERLVGFHFFNPVAVMPLLEVVKTSSTNEQTLSTAMVTAAKLGKSAVIVADRPGFVVNRLLAKVMGEAARAFDAGTPITQVEQAFAPLGLPMGPFELINLVGWKVAAHVQDTMVGAFPERFYASTNLHRLAEVNQALELSSAGKVRGLTQEARQAVTLGSNPMSAEDILKRLQDGLADEISIMLTEGVVSAPEDIDLCLILGAGWPFIDGGITPYLDRVGVSEQVRGAPFHNPMIRGVLGR